MFKSKNWFGGGLWRPKNPHSLEHLKYLHGVLSKNQVVTEDNKGLLVETLRSIAEILIWGDQNDSTVFDFFLEKNMLSFFLRIMKQKCGRYVCVQLLQTLNILFENIRNETSLYYLLSNNHVNSIIVHKFDFSDEEVMAYYISFLKTLSFKLNTHAVHFFYNEHTNDFPLYTEAIKFFNHSESMVRIAVRTLTLNVYKVEDKSMLKFIRDKTAAPYFSNLVWFIGSHVLELDLCIRNDADHQSRNRLSDLVAEHLDHMHYINDILTLKIDALNDVLTDHLLNRLLIPLYVYSLTKRRRHSQVEDDRPHVSSVVSLFLLSQVFLIITHKPLVRSLAKIILNSDLSIFSEDSGVDSYVTAGPFHTRPGFMPPMETLEQSLEARLQQWRLTDVARQTSYENDEQPEPEINENSLPDPIVSEAIGSGVESQFDIDANITDEEKQRQAQHRQSTEQNQLPRNLELLQESFSLSNRPYLEAVFNVLECSENDYAALFALCLLYAIGHNEGVNQDLLDTVFIPTERSETKHWYNINLVERLIKIICLSCQHNSKVRIATLEMTIAVLKQMVFRNDGSFLQDRHLASIAGAREESTLLLRNFYKGEEIFLDMFEDEYREKDKKPLNVEYLTMDPSILLPPTGTPLTGIEFSKRLPCGEVERARRAIRVFFLLRSLSLSFCNEVETQLPLTDPNHCIQVEEVLDLNNSDLIACTVVTKDGQKIRRFLVIDVSQLILVEPDSKRLGWGIAKFAGFLQDIEVSGDKDDSRCLQVTVHKPLSSKVTNRVPLLAAKFVFDDHIRCMAAKQRLTKGRLKSRQRKMHQIAKLLELPGHVQPCPSPPTHSLTSLRYQDIHRSVARGIAQDSNSRARSPTARKPLFVSSNKVPGFAAVMRKDTTGGPSSSSGSRSGSAERHRGSSSSPSRHGGKSSSQKIDIPMEVLSKGSPKRIKRSSTSSPQGFSSSSATTNLDERRLSGSATTSAGLNVLVLRDHHRKNSDGTAPKTLRPADSPTVSLLNNELSHTASPCIVPVTLSAVPSASSCAQLDLTQPLLKPK
ncbi:hypothetical protein CHUAL_011914 [Chamberlinius hualienensis]